VSLYCFENVRTEEQRAEMARLDAAGICLFCPDYLVSHPGQQILLSTRHWLVTPNTSTRTCWWARTTRPRRRSG